MTDEAERAWYVFATVPIVRIEFKIMYALNQRELPALCPFEEKYVKVKGRRAPARMKFALFPRYVFAQLPTDKEELAREYHGIKKHIDGVMGMLSWSQEDFDPVVLAPHDLELIRTLSNEGWRQNATTVTIHKAFQPGIEVTILKGPLTGQTAKVDAVSRRRISVLLHMLGSMRVVDFTAADLAVA